MNHSLFASLPSITQHEISQQLYAGDKINAIKLYRDAKLCDLLTAKQAVEAIETELRAKNPYAFRNKASVQSSVGLKVITAIISLALLLGGLGVFVASSLEETPLFSTTELKAVVNQIGSVIDSAPELEPEEQKYPVSVIPKEEIKKVVANDVQKTVYVEDKSDPTIDTLPYQPLTETITLDIASLYQEKLVNPAYLAWKNLPGMPRGYQDYLVEHRIKAKRTELARKLILPAEATAFIIPKLIHSTIHLDGNIDKNEWKNALLLPLTPKETGSVLYLQRDNDWLYLAADVPKDTTATGFDQFRFYIHIDIDPTIRNERVHVDSKSEQILGGIRETTVRWQGSINEDENERWKNYPVSDWQIYRLARGAAGLNAHRQYEAKLYLKEIGLSEAAPFPAFVEIETDAVYENGRFKKRVYLGELGSQEKPVWFKMQ